MSKHARRAAPDRADPSAGRRLEAWLWSGPAGHLLGGALDFAEALLRYYRARWRAR